MAGVAVATKNGERRGATILDRLARMAHGADAETATLRLDDGTDVALPLRDVRRAKLILTDALIEATAQLNPTSKMAN